MEECMNLHIENDKINAPFLLAASFHGLVEFVGRSSDNSVLYWQFSPKDKVLKLLEQFNTKTEPHIPARDLFEAINTWWQEVAEMRNGAMQYGER